jgi:hypothetical protein
MLNELPLYRTLLGNPIYFPLSLHQLFPPITMQARFLTTIGTTGTLLSPLSIIKPASFTKVYTAKQREYAYAALGDSFV